jgi:hypothetical protein
MQVQKTSDYIDVGSAFPPKISGTRGDWQMTRPVFVPSRPLILFFFRDIFFGNHAMMPAD